MMKRLSPLMRGLRAFVRDEEGAATISFVLVFPAFMTFFLMTYENGMISLRHVMLERGVDQTVRLVRIGFLEDPSREDLKAYICAYGTLVPNCESELRLEIVLQDAHNWDETAIAADAQCVDRGNPAAEEEDDDPNTLENNQLVFLRACHRFDPIMPTTGIGRAINNSTGGDAAAAGSYALISTASFVVEPFKSTTGTTNTVTTEDDDDNT